MKAALITIFVILGLIFLTLGTWIWCALYLNKQFEGSNDEK